MWFVNQLVDSSCTNTLCALCINAISISTLWRTASIHTISADCNQFTCCSVLISRRIGESVYLPLPHASSFIGISVARHSSCFRLSIFKSFAVLSRHCVSPRNRSTSLNSSKLSFKWRRNAYCILRHVSLWARLGKTLSHIISNIAIALANFFPVSNKSCNFSRKNHHTNHSVVYRVEFSVP